MLLKEMYDFLTLKMLLLALVLIKTKNRHLIDPLVRKCSFYMRILSFQWLEKLKKGIFRSMGQKDGDFFVLINEKKITHVLKKRFFGAPCCTSKLIVTSWMLITSLLN